MEYAQLQQNLLSSRSQDRMVELDGMAADAGKAFRMINRDAYSRMSALVTPKFVLEPLQIEDDFADAIARIPLGTPGMGMGPGQEM